MPELPEVETTRRGIRPWVKWHRLTGARVRQAQLRYPVPPNLDQRLQGLKVMEVARRGKYLILITHCGGLLIHLGMSGSLRVVPAATPPGPHDHVDILLGEQCLRLRDPRRFGSVLWSEAPEAHPLLARLGPEPLESAFGADYLRDIGQRRRIAIKPLLMNSQVVVGVGNIYANEALFLAGISPSRRSNRIAAPRYRLLVDAIKAVLSAAIECGGTTLRDFVSGAGAPGYFSQRLRVYGRAGEPCQSCGTLIRRITLAQRSTFYCPRCQR